jgi:hypothetical protein
LVTHALPLGLLLAAGVTAFASEPAAARDPVDRVLRSKGRRHFDTDAYGRRAAAGIAQLVCRRLRVSQRRERGGVENAFVMERPSDWGRRFCSAHFERGYCLLRGN